MPKLSKDQAKTAEESGGEFEPVPPGTYAATLVAVTEKKGAAGPYWEWEFQLHEDDQGNELERKTRLWENTSLSEQAIWRVAGMFAAFGVEPDVDTEDLIGEWLFINVGQEVAEQGAKQGQLRNTFISAFSGETEADEADEADEE